MKEQAILLERIRKNYNNPTYKQIASLSGIQLTRIFRLYNGFEMKLSEYLKLSSLLDQVDERYAEFDESIKQCKSELSTEELDHLAEIVSRKLDVKRIVSKPKKEKLA